MITQTEYTEYRKNVKPDHCVSIFEADTYQGKLFCGNCKANMVRIGIYRKVDGKIEYSKVFKCGTHHATPKRCDSQFIEEKILCDILHAAIQKQISLIKGFRKLIDKDVKYSFEGRMKNIMLERQRMINRQMMSEQEFMDMYKKYVSKEISLETFQKFRLLNRENVELYKIQLEVLEKEEKKVKKCRTSLKSLIEEWVAFDDTRPKCSFSKYSV